MAVRPIDAYALNNDFVEWYNDLTNEIAKSVLRKVMQNVNNAPTLTSPNEKPPCYLPEKDNPYPLCEGRGMKACAHCCLWEDYDPEEDESRVNQPLTIWRLREMDGEPVWIVDIGPHKWYGPGWAIVDRDNCLVRTVKNWNAVFFERYGERWLAYRRPKEEQ